MKKKLRIPSTFEIALLLTVFVMLFAFFLTRPVQTDHWKYAFDILTFWKRGFWELLEFTMQMVLILVLGHALALTKPVDKLLDRIIQNISSNTSAVLTTGVVAMFAGYFNWGFGLILGAILAVKISKKCNQEGVPINYPLIGASAYLGMLIWHGGLSGSAPLKVAESDHFLVQSVGVIPASETIFSSFNLVTNMFLVVVMVVVLYFLSKKKAEKSYPIPSMESVLELSTGKTGVFIGVIMVSLGVVDILNSGNMGLSFLDLNYINFMLFGLALLFYKSLGAFVKGVGVAVNGAVDIILQFPLYAGVLGIMKYSGLLSHLSEGLVVLGGEVYFPFLAFLSAAFINLFVPSGGGQWAIQGPIIMEAVHALSLDSGKMVIIFVFGDQVSNMLQPFWALPLLAMTGLSVKELFKYTSIFFLVGFSVFAIAIWIGMA